MEDICRSRKEIDGVQQMMWNRERSRWEDNEGKDTMDNKYISCLDEERCTIHKIRVMVGKIC